MLKSVSRRAAVVLAGSAIALTAAMLPAQAATTAGWRISATYRETARPELLLSVAAVSARDAWAAGTSVGKNGTSFQTVIRHWTGRTWAAVTLPAKIAKAWQKEEAFDVQVAASSPANV